MTIRGLVVVMMLGAGAVAAQKTTTAPATDSAAQASPIVATGKTVPTDAAAQASPEIGPSTAVRGPGFAARTVIPIVLAQAIDSGRLKNGQMVSARLSGPVGRMPVGTPVQVSVIATVPAGKLNAVGEFSLQVVRVGRVDVFTETQTFRGKPGAKDVADAAPAMGTDAGLAAGAELTFHVQPLPVAATGSPKDGVKTPGSVDGVASGDAPPAGAVPTQNSGKSDVPVVAPANTVSKPITGAVPPK